MRVERPSMAEMAAMYEAISASNSTPNAMLIPGAGRCPICKAAYSLNSEERAECEVSCDHMRSVLVRMEFAEDEPK